MDEEAINMQIRKSLKHFGVTAQQEVEKALREGLEDGSLKGDEKLKVRMRLEVETLPVDHTIEGELDLSARSSE